MRPWPGRIGDGAGTIEVPGNPNLWYVRAEGSDLPIPVYRGAAPRQEDYPIWVGQDVYNKRWLRILGTNIEQLSSGSTIITEVEPHGSSHGIAGTDPGYFDARQITNVLAYASTGMTVHVNGGWVIIDGQPVKIISQNIDMTASIPGSGAAYSIIRASSTGALTVVDGTPVDSLLDLDDSDAPAFADGYAPIALVRLWFGMTELSRSSSSPDVTPLYLAQVGREVAGALADHDHSGDAGDGGTFDAANLTSGAATDGFVLMADGSGGAAWETTYNDAEGNPADVDETAAADGTSAYAARRDHRHKLGTVNLNDLDDVDTTGVSDGAALVYDAGSSEWHDSILIRDIGTDARIGNINDYLNIDTDGTITMVGDARVFREVRLDASIAVKGAAAPTTTIRAVGASGNVKVPVTQFSKITQQDLYFEIHAPSDLDSTEDVYFHLMWFPGAAWSAGNFMWKLEYLIVEETGVELNAGAPTTISADVTPVAATNVIETEFATAISGFAPERLIWCHFYRDVANDNSDDVGEVRFFEIEYVMNKLGEKFTTPASYLIDDDTNQLIDDNGDMLTD